MPTNFNYTKSYLLDNNPGLIGTYGNPAAPTVGDTDWSGVNASTASVDDAFNLTNGQIPIGKTGAAAVPNPTPAPVLTAGTSGSLLAGTYEVAYTWKRDAYSETQISPIGSITFGSGTTNKISIAAVTPLPATITSVNWYMSDAPGSITLKFIANNSGGAFSISTLPIGGAPPIPPSNTTATNNHPIKATLTGSNGVGVTNGPGSITLGLAVTGDISASGGVVTVGAVNGVAVTGTPTTGQVITATGTSAAHWATPAGGSISLTSAHVLVGNGSNVATDVAMSGDATIANTGAVTVTKINGVSVSGTPATGQVPTATGTTTATWQTPSGGGGGGIASGTSFPGSPASGDIFFRTDLGTIYQYVTGFSGPTATWYPVGDNAFKDGYTRSNSSTTPGAADTLQKYVSRQGTWGISTNQLYSVTDANLDTLTASINHSNYAIQIVAGGLFTSPNFNYFQIVLKRLDANNYLLINYGTNFVGLYKLDAGTQTVLTSATPTLTDSTNNTICTIFSGADVDVWSNGTHCFTYTISGTDLKYLDYGGVGWKLAKSGTTANNARGVSLLIRAI